MAVLKFVGLMLLGCWVVKLVTDAISPILPSLTVIFIVAVVVVILLFPRTRL